MIGRRKKEGPGRKVGNLSGFYSPRTLYKKHIFLRRGGNTQLLCVRRTHHGTFMRCLNSGGEQLASKGLGRYYASSKWINLGKCGGLNTRK